MIKDNENGINKTPRRFYHSFPREIKQIPTTIERLLVSFENGYYSKREFIDNAKKKLGRDFGEWWATGTISYFERSKNNVS